MSETATEWASGISDQLLRRSFHEASHAVIGRILDLNVIELTVLLDGENDEIEGGHTSFDIPETHWPLKVKGGPHFTAPPAIDHPIASRWWVATRAGGVGSVDGMALLDKTITYEDLMQDTALSDDAELRDALNELAEDDRPIGSTNATTRHGHSW